MKVRLVSDSNGDSDITDNEGRREHTIQKTQSQS
jgi:hypothetical protein